MKHQYWIVVGAAIYVALAGCSSTAAPLPTPAAAATLAPAASGVLTASVKVVPAQSADLAFVIPGPVKDVAVKEGQQVQAGQALVTLDAPDLSYGVIGAQAALKSAQDDAFIQSQGRRKWNGFKFVWMSGPPEQLQEANARVDQAQAGLAVAQAELAQATLTAPFSGTVTSIAVSAGEMVAAQQVVLRLGSLDRLQVETTDLSERLISAVRIGDAATVRLKAFDASLSGRVTAIAPLAGISSDGDTIFKVTIQLDRQPAGLLWGMTGDVDIQTR